MTPELRAKKSAEVMWGDDPASQALGMSLDDIGPGRSVMRMTVRGDMANGHGMCHGGFIFTLADSAFAFACNSYNTRVVAQHNSITYLSPGQLGEILTASATEVSRAGRSGIYDVEVTGEDGRKLALFRGHSRQIKGVHFDEEHTEG
ncbi:hydroxyphenylacetyl-CoA thioesterase PaaI [Aliiroseovarius lamellibrachiae]|uniref:hydroxyphenylacetyl-CoA thioesterase PaaI n=1 Tax=Aliiroseovarius lamellibrachiae TaxID=1924933 RepID=UPI001BE116EF|nr:hydroxyphenylacetyl-CoA thioesterase PaaI [Aliiroseovarius lamellibrachiae]MBT2130236.1 hydroxyphenylacetyl-CoA thioesterase PaaI [Aliiroseovarius lamellibrachiae]